jgi:lysozyme
MGQRTTPDRALVRLLADAQQHERELRACIGDVALHQHEWDAYVSWVFNVGTGAACSSTLVRKLRADPPDYAGACRELLRWNRQAGRVLPGLTKRRQAEFEQCTGGSTRD